MNIPALKGARLIGALVIVSLVASCGLLPRSGPNQRQLLESSVQRQGDAFVVDVNQRVLLATSVVPALGFSPEFLSAVPLNNDVIRPGDTLGLTIYENVEDGLLASQGVNAAIIEEVQVDGAGMIFIPYAGRVRAAGNTPDQLRQVITENLDEQTPDPQVLVSRITGDGATVSILGAVSGQGVYPLERPNGTLSSMLASAGGLAIAPEIAQVTVVRGAHEGTVWFEDLFEPGNDIALRPGDRILVEEDSRSFTALGATGAQTIVPFDTRVISAMEAIAAVGGLNPDLADPTGVFILRNEPQEIVQQVLGRTDIVGTQRMIYVLDLTEPSGMFQARDFVIRDGDTLYVTEAPYAQFARILSALTGTAGAATTLESAAE